jgi:O-antigen ligase
VKQNAASILVAAYIFLCIVLGGSAQDIWGNLALQLLGVALIAWAAVHSPAQGTEGRPRALYWLLLASVVVVVLQLVPLPPSLWTNLPGREGLSAGFDLLGEKKPPLSISESPFDSVMTLFAAIPAIAVFCATERLRPSPRVLAIVTIAGTLLAITVGALQVAGGPDSWAYFYPITNIGAVGFFANQNHMATLLLVSIPFTMALIYSSVRERGSSKFGMHWTGVVILLLLLFGVALNGSLAAYALVVPVLLASLALGPAGVRWRRFAIPVAVIAVAAAVAVMISAPMGQSGDDPETSRSVASRLEVWRTTTTAIAESFPVGTGLGSFDQVYRQQENPLAVTQNYVNHAHNEYLELVLELGLAGVLLIAGFLLWWALTTARIWRSHLSTPFAKASTIVTAAVLTHSIVDFPIRTGAISAIFAAALAFMTQHSATFDKSREARPTRHVKLG